MSGAAAADTSMLTASQWDSKSSPAVLASATQLQPESVQVPPLSPHSSQGYPPNAVSELPSIPGSHLLSNFPNCHVFLQISPGSWPKAAIPKAQEPWSHGWSIAGFLITPRTPCSHPGTAWAAQCRSSQGHHHGFYNCILDEISKFPFIYIPTLPSSFPLFMPKISTEFTGNSMKVIRSPPGLGFESACLDYGRLRPSDYAASGPKQLCGLGQGVCP